MGFQPIEIMRELAGLIAGAILGSGFGIIQTLALRRNEKMEQSGSLKTGWAVMPGSMRRVAYLLIALVLVQIICPLLFVNGTQWWVSGGVVAGYAAILSLRIMNRKNH